jgi:hypothetical protein
MLRSLADVNHIADLYSVPPEDVLLIALNASGARSSLPFPRARFTLRLASHPSESFFQIVSLARPNSPFYLTREQLFLGSESVADVVHIDNDDVVVSYFRDAGRALTLNSNARSHCVGCVFCYNTLETTSDPTLRSTTDLHTYARLIELERGPDCIPQLYEITVCTGCFQHENLAIDHLRSVRAVFGSYGFTGTVRILSSVIRSADAFAAIADDIAPFHLTLTVECFSHREDVLKHSKATLTPEEMPAVLERARHFGFDVDFTYIVGLDTADVTIAGIESLYPYVTRFPRFQIYQPHNAFMEYFRAPDAARIEYYLAVRGAVERLFATTALRPQVHHNYRPLWYLRFAGENIDGARI